MRFKQLEEHQRDLENLSRELRHATHKGAIISLSRERRPSSTTRNATYKNQCQLLDLSSLSAICAVDTQAKIVLAEPKVTMEALTKATLPYNLIPAVVPEFRHITVGGAIMGAALESSSHREGQFNDTCLWVELLLATGEIIHASPSENSDLFWALPGSFGTLALITLAAIRLVPSSRYIRLKTTTYSSREALFTAFGRPHSAQFVEGLSFSPSSSLLLEGEISDAAPLRLRRLSRPWNPWFYQHLLKTALQMRKASSSEELIPTLDYLFRYDKAAFWMGRYALDLRFLRAFLFGKDRGALPRSDRLATPSLLFRCLFYKLLTCQSLYRRLHLIPEELLARFYLIQDCYIPYSQALTFTQNIESTLSLSPLWLCPVLGTERPAILSPHYRPEGEKMMVNIGLYGSPHKPVGALPLVEALTRGCKGRKMLYGRSSYSQGEFWSIYDELSYKRLRHLYGAEGRLVQLTDKLLLPKV